MLNQVLAILKKHDDTSVWKVLCWLLVNLFKFGRDVLWHLIVAIPDNHAIFVLFGVDAPHDLAFLKSFLPLSHLLLFFCLFVAIVTGRFLIFGTLAWQMFLFFNVYAIVWDNMTVTDNWANQSVV